MRALRARFRSVQGRLAPVAFVLLSAAPAMSDARPGAAERSGSVRGVVSDPSGAPVPGAAVTLLHLVTGTRRQIRTSASGEYAFPEVPPGRYASTATADGFQPLRRELVLAADAVPGPVVVDFRLEVAPRREIVTVVEGTSPTASRMAIPLRELPVTVSRVGVDILREQGSNDLVSALRNVAGVNAYIGYGLYEYYVFRGFGFGHSVQLVDGVRNEGNRINTQLANVEAVEVLKGPASVLYGGEAIGGAVNLIRKRPSAAPTYELALAAGRWGARRTSAGASGPAWRDRLLYRIDASYAEADGWRPAPSRLINVSPSLHWNAGTRGHLVLQGSFSRDRFATDAGIPLVGGRVPAIPLSRRFNTPADFAESVDLNLQARYTHALSDQLRVRQVAGYRRFDDEYLSAEFLSVNPPRTVERGFLYFHHHRRPLLTQTEVLADFHLGVPHRVVAGWQFQRFANVTDRSAVSRSSAAPIDLFEPVETQRSPEVLINRLDRFRNRTHALYLQDHIALGERTRLLVAGRLDFFRRWSRNDSVADGQATEGPAVRRRADALTGRVGLVQDTGSSGTVYASWATSFRPVTVVPADGRDLEPEEGRQLELGYRIALLGGRLSLNPALYEIVKRNVAVSRGGGVYEQAAGQRSRGLELELSAAPIPAWRLSAAYGWTSAAFLEYQTSAADLSGRRPRFVPRHTASLWTTYSWPSGARLSLGGRHVGRVFADDANTVPLGGYTVVDTAVAWRRGPLEVSLNVTNALDRRGYFVSAINDDLLYPGRPLDLLLTIRIAGPEGSRP